MRNITPTRPPDPTKIDFYLPALIIPSSVRNRARNVLALIWLYQIVLWGVTAALMIVLRPSAWWIVIPVVLSIYGNSGWFEDWLRKTVAKFHGD